MRVKKVYIALDYSVWTFVIGFKLRRSKSHVGPPNVSKLTIYKSLLWHPKQLERSSI